MKTKADLVLLLPGLYFIFTGMWALLDVQSFQVVTGQKIDIWLVKTFSGLICAVGLSFVINAFRMGEKSALYTALLCLPALIIADIYYALTNIISKIYLADAAIEMIFLIFLILRFLRISDHRKLLSSFPNL
jgi:hypothetical protein